MRDLEVGTCGGRARASLSLRSAPAELSRLVGFARGFARHCALPSTEQGRLLIILEELFTNVVNHGYDDAAFSGRIEVALALEAGWLNIEFSDNGRRFDPLIRTQSDFDQSRANRGIGGLGLHIVRSLVDEARYTRDGERNRLSLKRRVASEQDRVSKPE
jgi:anti-sigma regulatory factor (Ser/Thr protein kinase)